MSLLMCVCSTAKAVERIEFPIPWLKFLQLQLEANAVSPHSGHHNQQWRGARVGGI